MKESPAADRVYLESMVDAIWRIRRYVGRRRRAGFLADPLLQDAVMRNIEVIGEAAGRVSREFASRHPGVPWGDIAGMRHRLIHGYLSVNLNTVWLVVERDLGPLKKQLDALVPGKVVPARARRKPRSRRPRR